MSKRNRRNKKSVKRESARRVGVAKPRRRHFLRGLIMALVGFGAVGVGLAAYKQKYDETHDLSVIGNGSPVVVQLHDPGCQLCQQLKRNASSAIDDLGQPLLYRIADIKTPEGQALQRRYQEPHVTLLLFDGSGKLRNVINGVQDDEVLLRAFERHWKRWGKA